MCMCLVSLSDDNVAGLDQKRSLAHLSVAAAGLLGDHLRPRRDRKG